MLVNLPMQLVRDVTSGSIAFGEGEYTIIDEAKPLPVAAGWPETFYRRYEDMDGVEPFVSWSTHSLIRNVGFGLTISVAIGLVPYLLKRSKRTSTAEPEPIRKTKFRFSISDIILLTSIIALPLGYYQWHRRLYEKDLQLVQAFGPDATYARETIIPALIRDWIPSQFFPVALRGAMMRTTMVRLNDPTDAQVVAAMLMLNCVFWSSAEAITIWSGSRRCPIAMH